MDVEDAEDSALPEFKALIIEDDRVTMKVSTAYLKDLGFEVFQAESVIIALETMLAHTDISVVFVDLHLGAFSGLAFVRALGREERYRHVKMFMLTIETAKNAVRAAITDGAHGYLLKPVNRRQYIRCLCDSGILGDITTTITKKDLEPEGTDRLESLDELDEADESARTEAVSDTTESN